MTDRMTLEQRHHCMQSIRSKGTTPELRVRRWLWRHGYRYRLNVRSVPGSPDLVLRRYRTAIFVNGCFWHGHEGCRSFKMPQSNTLFWNNKIRRNRERDQRNYALLAQNGWHVIVIWECQLKRQLLEVTMRNVEIALNNNLLDQYRHTTPIRAYADEESFSIPLAAEDTL